jgi:hypothetical protein
LGRRRLGAKRFAFARRYGPIADGERLVESFDGDLALYDDDVRLLWLDADDEFRAQGDDFALGRVDDEASADGLVPIRIGVRRDLEERFSAVERQPAVGDEPHLAVFVEPHDRIVGKPHAAALAIGRFQRLADGEERRGGDRGQFSCRQTIPHS